MSRTTAVLPPLTDELLQEVVRRILEVGSPERIIMFGSRARGTARPDSDLDLLIIEESEIPRFKRAPRYYLALTGTFLSEDIVVWTPQEADDWRNVPNSFISTALREGKTLYARSG